MAFEIWAGIISGFSTGLGVGVANWLFIKRLERFEEKLLKKKQEDNNART